MSVLVLGTLAFDSIETPFGKKEKVIAGSGTFLSLAASFFTKPVQVVSIVGEDFPVAQLELMHKHNIQTEGVEQRRGGKTFHWSGRYSNDLNSRETLATDLNVLADYEPVVPEGYKRPDYLMLGNFSPKIQLSVLRQLKHKPRLVVMDTMNFWMDTDRTGVLETLAEVDVLTINDEEARQLAGEYSLVKAARKILTMGPDYLIIKKGENGALLFHRSDVFFAPALPLEEVFDPTGAGDSFAGGFIGYLASTKDVSFENMKSAVVYGSAVASFCVEQFGPERLYGLHKDEIRDRCHSFLELVQIDMQLV